MLKLRNRFAADSTAETDIPQIGAIDALSSDYLTSVLDNMPVNVMACDPATCEINYINRTSIETLRTLRHLLPASVDPDNMIGVCIDVFHKDPSHQRRILADPKNLPWKAKIKLGPETLDLLASAIYDANHNYIGAMVTWSVVTQLQNAISAFETNVKGAVAQVSSNATEMRATAESMSATAEETTRQATSAASGAEQATSNVQTVASAAEEMTNSITEITQQVSQSSRIASTAVDEAQRTNDTVQGLSEASERIGEVVNLIQDIASQTNLLALNATIEAARAGEAGKGFAVVASEVKELASQTARATEDITIQIQAIQEATGGAVSAIGNIGQTINEMNEITAAVAAAIEEQAAATQEISRNVQEAATGTQEVSSNMGNVSQAADETGRASGQVLESANELSSQSERLSAEVEKFLEEVKKL